MLRCGRPVPAYVPVTSKMSGTPSTPTDAYTARLAAEDGIYRNCLNVHNLPDIFHYWSNRHVRPKLERLGVSSPNDLFRKYAAAQFDDRRHRHLRFVSIGSGNCDLEIDLASQFRSAGRRDFTIDCVDLNPAMLDRGRVSAEKNDLLSSMNFVAVDLNEWAPTQEYDAVIANQILHHVVKLEDLFARIRNCLLPEGTLIVSDMIGRNGHQRWPEALDMVHKFWRRLPPSYRFNHLLQRYEELFEDWDCSGQGFEGIRSQDILPLLVECFHFRFFFGFANVIDPFVDRAFGYSFDANAPWDRDFIDEVNRCDEDQINSGRMQPTHMLAVLSNSPGSMIFHEPLTPQFCLRKASPVVVAAPLNGSTKGPPGAYEWHSWPHSAERELEIACERLKRFQQEAHKQTAWALQFEKELEARTAWALDLDQKLQESTVAASQLQNLVEERTAWALKLDKELEDRNAHIVQLNSQLEEQTAWAVQLQQHSEQQMAQLSQLKDEIGRLAWARPIDRRFHGLMHALYRTVRWSRNRIRRRKS